MLVNDFLQMCVSVRTISYWCVSTEMYTAMDTVAFKRSEI